MKDDRVENTEPWTPQNSRRLWIVVFVTLVIEAIAIILLLRAFFGMLGRMPAPG